MDTKFSRLQILVLFCHTTIVFCQTTDSTSSVVPTTPTTTELPDGLTSNGSLLPKPVDPAVANIFAPQNGTNLTTSTPELPTENVSEEFVKQNVSKSTSFVSEGGSVNVSPPAVVSNITYEENSNSNNLTATSLTSKEEDPELSLITSNATDPHHQSKGRKGVEIPTTIQPCVENCEVSETNDNGGNVTSVKTLYPSLENTTASVTTMTDTSQLPLSNKTSQEVATSASDNSTSLSSVANFVHGNSTVASGDQKKKPTYTLDEVSKQHLSPPSPESKYIIPVVATILVVPLVAGLFMFLYRRGAEFWERRHYRRMDFLIDGMYND